MVEELIRWPAHASLTAKLGVSLTAIAVAWTISAVARLGGEGQRPSRSVRTKFWFQQVLRIGSTLLWIAALLWIWIDSSRLGTIAAVIVAGVTVALQKVVTSIAGYLSILRGNTFTVGEMGQPETVQDDKPAMWVAGRQYTGRIVTITNDKVFDTPVYNYTREFPFLWEEIRVPVKYHADWRGVETMLREVAGRHTRPLVDDAKEALPRLLERFTLYEKPSLEPATFVQITDNWIGITVRFLVRDHGVRELKSAMSRDILAELRRANIDVASTTMEVGVTSKKST